eukprot:3898201-Rhodomonas_salina.3
MSVPRIVRYCHTARTRRQYRTSHSGRPTSVPDITWDAISEQSRLYQYRASHSTLLGQQPRLGQYRTSCSTRYRTPRRRGIGSQHSSLSTRCCVANVYDSRIGNSMLVNRALRSIRVGRYQGSTGHGVGQDRKCVGRHQSLVQCRTRRSTRVLHRTVPLEARLRLVSEVHWLRPDTIRYLSTAHRVAPYALSVPHTA